MLLAELSAGGPMSLAGDTHAPRCLSHTMKDGEVRATYFRAEWG